MSRPTLLHTGATSHDVNILDTVQERKFRERSQPYTKTWLFAASGVLAIAGAWGAFAAFGPAATDTASQTTPVSAAQATGRAPVQSRNIVVDTAPIAMAPHAVAPVPAVQPAVETRATRVDTYEAPAIATTQAAPVPARKNAEEAATRRAAPATVGGSSATPRQAAPATAARTVSKREVQARAAAEAVPRPRVQARSQPSPEQKDPDVELLSALMRHMRHSDQPHPPTRAAQDATASCRTGRAGDAKCPTRVASP
jgi:hypothetical protein